MVLNDKESILTKYGVGFHNWPGPGEAAADFFGLSHAVVIPLGNGASRVLLSGQVGILADDSVPADLGEEITEIFESLGRALRSAGFGEDSWQHIVKINSFQVHTPGLEEVLIPIARKYLKGTKPSWTGVTVHSLFRPDLHLEVEVEAYLPASYTPTK